jgi:hypothetical protein
VKTIWVVGGSSGEYSDHREWFICYYTTEAKAKAHAENAAARYRAIRAEIGDDPECGSCYSGPKDYCEVHKHIKNEWDAKMEADSSGVNYYAFPLDPWKPAPQPDGGKP